MSVFKKVILILIAKNFNIMLKNISNLGETLSKVQQQKVHGGKAAPPDCPIGCGGKEAGDTCYNSAGCNCQGTCKSFGGNIVCDGIQ
ncbi:hypothetical protein [uncultured Dokdonia sp.]|uniref:hypothetical protein n=1 Tax=uncultured Dokdonia sp. TaxID=575653 RepID=UPI002629CB96|nr:hypothetical protein [uncultured Dokdonia sp.]